MNKTIEAPAIAKAHGMTQLVFEDDFDSLDTIDVENTGREGFKWYIKRPFKATVLEPDDYKVENSVLTVCNKLSTYNYGLGSMHPGTLAGFAFNKGVLEFRIRIPRPRPNTEEEHGSPAVWSFPPRKLSDEATAWVEADWMEYWGDGYYTTTFHDCKSPAPGEPFSYWMSNPNHRGPKAFDDGEWHTMTFLWVDGSVESWLDGEPAVKQTYTAAGADPAPYVHKGEPDRTYMLLNEEPEALILGGAAVNPLEIDWIRVWQAPADKA